MDTHLLIRLIILILLLVLSAFFSSAETALTTVNKIKLKTMADDGNKKAARVLNVVTRPKKMLSAILIGNNIVNLSASSLATTLAIDIFGSVGAGIATGILTLLILIFGEITPKSIATINSTSLSLLFAPIISGLMWLLTPVIIIINFLAGLCIKLFGIDPDFKDDTITEDELRIMVDASHQSGEIEGDERTMIHKVFDFSDACAKEVMIPRIDMTMVDADISYNDLISVFKEDMFTRLPVCEPDSEKIIGMVNMKDFLGLVPGDDFSVRNYLRDVYFTYEMKNVSDLFDEMREESTTVSIVLDEYGDLSGMITMEDLLEEIVGEIRDEYDEDEEDPIVRLNDREYQVLGSMNLEDLCNIIPLGFTSEDYDTIGGYIVGAFDHFPNAGETYVSENGTIVRVLAVDKKRITKLRIKLPYQDTAPQA
ncbi:MULTISPECIES: HlyC/CorC family transporter [Pseudobutyrivibrio]|uniref:Hemolysin, contains CBS domains n=1 Tax=Pseudobutyrivibrio ruminis DSM 9787 TaxID=1123011 RepID=A0A285SK90_9FIRM|nr:MULTISPECIES: hemolysin family protein [Pseudobutyrivibrio]SFN82481.1 Hemolysin, contains CBS domains [Pseudobutyrivibrio sp. JW11]SOC08384.1 Hemolysin, contains CBS domains [Pseudobutyrivibrio ruminis DSM 9787]